MIRFFPILLAACLLVGCAGIAPRIEDEEVPAVSAVRQTAGPAASSRPPDGTLEQKMTALSFVMVSGNYARKCMQDNVEYTEMFAAGQNEFVRMAAGENEEEIYAYDYVRDEFTYLYYFDGELVSKLVYGIGADMVVEDENGLIDLLKDEAVELKQYFEALIGYAGLTIKELTDGGL